MAELEQPQPCCGPAMLDACCAPGEKDDCCGDGGCACGGGEVAQDDE